MPVTSTYIGRSTSSGSLYYFQGNVLLFLKQGDVTATAVGLILRSLCECRIQKHEKRLEMLPTAVLKGVIKQSSTGYTGELSGITIKPAMYAQSELVKVNGTPTLAINLLLRKRNPTYDGVLLQYYPAFRLSV